MKGPKRRERRRHGVLRYFGRVMEGRRVGSLWAESIRFLGKGWWRRPWVRGRLGRICGREWGVCSGHGGGYLEDIRAGTGIIPLAVLADAGALEGALWHDELDDAWNIVDSAELVDGCLCEISSYSGSG